VGLRYLEVFCGTSSSSVGRGKGSCAAETKQIRTEDLHLGKLKQWIISAAEPVQVAADSVLK